jgi:WD40 repeat protein
MKYLLVLALHLVVLFLPLSTRGLAQTPELLVQKGHTNLVSSVAVGPGGRILASGSWDNTVILWDISTGRGLRTLKHSGGVNSVAFNPDGNILASGGDDGVITLWDVAIGKQICTPTGHTSAVNSVTFNSAGNILASGSGEDPINKPGDSDNHTVRLWDVATCGLLKTLEGHSSVVNSVVFSPNGEVLASAGAQSRSESSVLPIEEANKTIRLWDVITGEELRVLTGHPNVKSIAFSRDGQKLASASPETSVRVWEVATGQALYDLQNSSGTSFVKYSPDGKMLAGSSGLEVIKLWDVSTGKEIHSIPGPPTSIDSFAFTVDGKFLISGGWDKTIRLWNVDTGREHSVIDGYASVVESISFDPGQKVIASGGWDGTVRLWDIRTGEEVRILKLVPTSVRSVAFSRDGRIIASANTVSSADGKVLPALATDKTIRLWDVVTGKLLRTQGHSALKDHSNSVNSIAFNHDGEVLASGGDDRKVKLWDGATGKHLRTLGEHSSSAFFVVFSPDGKRLASADLAAEDSNPTVKLWNATTGKELLTLNGSSGPLAFSRDGKMLAVVGANYVIKLLDADTGRELRPLEGHIDSVYGLDFSPDGKVLASASFDKTVKLWNISTGRVLYNLEQHSDSVNTVSFSSDGRWLATGSRDGSIQIWDWNVNEHRLTLLSLREGKGWLAVAPDGLFDGTAEAMQHVSWRISDSNEVVPLESFFNDFYHPGLLSEVLEGGNPKAIVDIATVLQLPGLRVMLSQGAARIERRDTKAVLCFAEKPTAEPRVFSDAQPLAYYKEDLTFHEDDPICRWRMELPDGRQYEVVSATSATRTEVSKLAYDETKSETAGSVLHVQAFGVGAYDFEVTGFKPLPASVSSAKEVERFFMEQQAKIDKPYRDIRVWDGLYDPTATRERIRGRLSELAQMVNPEDVVFLFFSGHGTVPAGQEMFYFVTADTRGPSPQDVSATALNTAMLTEAIRKMPARRVVLVFDACQSGGTIESLAKLAEAKAMVESRKASAEKREALVVEHGVGVYVIAAATPLQQAVQPIIGNSALVQALLEALRVEDTMTDRKVWVRSMVSRVKQRLPEIAEALGQRHDPMVITSGLDFALAHD